MSLAEAYHYNPQAQEKVAELDSYYARAEEMALGYLFGDSRRTIEDFAQLINHASEEGEQIPDDFYDRLRGREKVRFSQVACTGVTNEGLIQVRTDESGFHRLVILVDKQGRWTEPTVYDGSNVGDKDFRVDYAKLENSRPWSPRATEEGGAPFSARDSIYIGETDGIATVWLHDGLTGADTLALPLEEVHEAIHDIDKRPDAEIIDLAKRRQERERRQASQ